MSFKKEKRDLIERYILEKIYDGNDNIPGRTAESFNISLNTVYRYIRKLEKEGTINKQGREYTLSESSEEITLSRDKGELTAEDIIYDRYVAGYFNGFADNVQRIWRYSFTEMMNNVIEHSESEIAVIKIYQNVLYTKVLITDRGLGIFKNIQEYFGFESTEDAVNELFKGKLTTDPAHHSGEGIFFTSRIMDKFAIVSYGKVFSIDKYDNISEDIKHLSIQSGEGEIPGTVVYMELSNCSNKVLRELFDMYADPDGGFTKTRIPLKNIFDDYPVSRSQARRLCRRFDKFEEVELDFDCISEIGQGFAHEIFVVFENQNKNVRIIAINANDDVKRMINHVIKSADDNQTPDEDKYDSK